MGGPLADAPSGVVARLRRRDPGLAALRRAARVTVAGCVAFGFGQFVLRDDTFALYAVFAAIALGVLSDVTGTPAQRTRLFLAAWPVGLALVTLGTLLAVDVWAAAAGMLVVGFCVVFAGIGGPRVAGLGNGLQLFYILPCFPPFDPGSLPSRLAGLSVGLLLLALADRVLWPPAAPRDFADRLAAATGPLVAWLDAVAARGATDPALPAAATSALRELSMDRVPRAERPAGPGIRDRSLTVAAVAARSAVARMVGLTRRVDAPRPIPDAVAVLLAETADALRPAAAALRGAGPAPRLEPLDDALARFLDLRVALVAAGDTEIQRHDMRCGTAAVMVVESVQSLVVAVAAAVGAPVPQAVRSGRVAPATFSYLTCGLLARWGRRFRTHLSIHSVYLQNAVRLAVGLAAARLIADLPQISHGFWVLLATLTLMRTSLVASRAALVPAFAGVTIGALLAGLLLVAVGDHVTVYVVGLPIVMFVGLAMGPLLGAAAGQIGFTVLIAVLFAQVAPATWRLAETRLVDVVLGGLIGALIGAAVWPRGGAGEMRRTAAAVLRAGAADVLTTVRQLTGTTADPPPVSGALPLIRLDATFAQYRAEGSPSSAAAPTVDWLALLGVGHRLVDEADLLRGRHPPAAPVPWPDVVTAVEDAAGKVASGLAAGADALVARTPPGPDAGPALHRELGPHPPPASYSTAPQDALRVIDAWGWLHVLAEDLTRLHRAAEAPADRVVADSQAGG